MSKQNVLVVEDDRSVSRLLHRYLTQFGYNCFGPAVSGEEAIQIASSELPDLVLMDIELEGVLDGITASVHIREVLGIPVIFVTGKTDKATFQRAKMTGPYAFLTKPPEETELCFAIELALEQHRRINSVKTAQDTTTHPSMPQATTSETDKEQQDNDIELGLEQVRLLSQLPKSTLCSFAACCQKKCLPHGRYVSLQGVEESHGFIVLSGSVLLLKESPEAGRELLLDLVPAYDFSGLIRILAPLTGDVTARTNTETSLLLVPRSAFLLLLDEHPDLYPSIIAELSQVLQRQRETSRSLAHDKVETRIAKTLRRLAERLYPESSSEKRILPLTRRELADFTGATPETAIRITKKWEREGLLSLNKNGAIEVLNQADFSEYLD